METIVDRIKQFIDYKGISIRKFEEAVGFSNGAFASQYKNRRNIGSDKIENILHIYTEISPTWLLTGNGDMLVDEKEEILPSNCDKCKILAAKDEVIASKDEVIKAQQQTIDALLRKSK